MYNGTQMEQANDKILNNVRDKVFTYICASCIYDKKFLCINIYIYIYILGNKLFIHTYIYVYVYTYACIYIIYI